MKSTNSSNELKQETQHYIFINKMELDRLEINLAGKPIKFQVSLAQLEQKSPYLASQLISTNFEDDDVDHVFAAQDFDLELFLLMLKYVCNDEMPSDEVLGRRAIKLLGYAFKYKVDSLKQICENYLINYATWNESTISDDTLILYLKTAFANDAQKLKHKCFFCIRKQNNEILQNPKWKKFVLSNPSIYQELYEDLLTKSKLRQEFDKLNTIQKYVILPAFGVALLWGGFSMSRFVLLGLDSALGRLLTPEPEIPILSIEFLNWCDYLKNLLSTGQYAQNLTSVKIIYKISPHYEFIMGKKLMTHVLQPRH